MVWGFLEKANNSKQAFDDKLTASPGFSMTKWFDGLSHHVRPICFAMAMATGAVACTQTAHAAEPIDAGQPTLQTQVETLNDHVGLIAKKGSLHEQASYIAAMSPDMIADLAEQIKAPNASADLPHYTVTDYAAHLAADGAQVDIDDGFALQNPYVDGQTIPVHAADDMGVHLKSLMAGETSLGVIKYAMTSDSPFALQNNFDNDSLVSERAQTMLMMPDYMPGDGWTQGMNLEQDIAFTLFHEIAHTHMIQTLAKYDLSINAQEAEAAHESPYFVEAHADVTAAIATGKAYDIQANEMIQILNDEIQLNDGVMLGNLPGSDNYRPQNGYAVLVEMLQENPDLLSEVSDREVPVLAYDIVKQAGFDHSKAGVLLSTTLESLPESAQANGYAQDRTALDEIRSAFPGNDILHDKAGALDALWGDFNGARTLSGLADKIDKTQGYDLVADRTKATLVQTADHLADAHPDRDLANLINDRVEAIQSGEQSFAQGMKTLSEEFRQAASQAPSLADLDAERTELLADISDELTYQANQALANDPLSYQAVGVGSDAATISGNLMERYNIGQFAEALSSPQLAQQ